MARFKISFMQDVTDAASGFAVRAFDSFKVDDILNFINNNNVQGLSLADNSLSEEKLQQLLSGLSDCFTRTDTRYKNIAKNIVRINLQNLGLKPENAKDIGRIIAAAAPKLSEINLDDNPGFFTTDSVASLMSTITHARSALKEQGKVLSELGSDIGGFYNSQDLANNSDYKSKLAEYNKQWFPAVPADKKISEKDSETLYNSSSEEDPEESGLPVITSLHTQKSISSDSKKDDASSSTEALSADGEIKEKITAPKSPKAKFVPQVQVVQTRNDLDYEIRAKIPGDKGRLILAYAGPKNGVEYSRNLSAVHAKTIFVFGDNFKMWNRRNKVELAGKNLEKVKHPGSGQAFILGGRLRKNVIGIPTCDVHDKAELQGYITATIQKIKDDYIDKGYDVVLPTLDTGEINMGTGLAAGINGKRQPKDFGGEDVANFIAAEITRIIGVKIPLYKDKGKAVTGAQEESASVSFSVTPDSESDKGREKEWRINTSSSSRSSASGEEMKVLSSKGKEKEAPVINSKTLFKIDAKNIKKDTGAVGKKVYKDRNYNLSYLFEEIEKGKFDYVSFSRTDLSGLQCAKRDAKGKIISGGKTEGEVLAKFIAQNEIVKEFDFTNTNVPSDFFKSLAINIENKSISRPNSKFVLEHIGMDISKNTVKDYALLNGTMQNQFKDGAIADAKKAREDCDPKVKIADDFVRQLAAKIKSRTSIATIRNLMNGFNADNDQSGKLLTEALNTPTSIGKHNGITLLHHLAYESGSKFFTRSRHKYMKNVAEVLLGYGLDPSEKDTNGRTARVLATQIGNRLHPITDYSYQNMDLINYLEQPTQEALDRRFVREFVTTLKDGEVPDIGKKMQELQADDKTLTIPKHEIYFRDLLNRPMDIGGVQKATLLKYATRVESYPDGDTFHANAAGVAKEVIGSAGFAGGSTLLYALSQTEHDAKLVKVLIDKDPFAKITLQEKNANGKGPVQLAAEHKGNADVLKVLLETGKSASFDRDSAYAAAASKENLSVLNPYVGGGKSHPTSRGLVNHAGKVAEGRAKQKARQNSNEL